MDVPLLLQEAIPSCHDLFPFSISRRRPRHPKAAFFCQNEGSCPATSDAGTASENNSHTRRGMLGRFVSGVIAAASEDDRPSKNHMARALVLTSAEKEATKAANGAVSLLRDRISTFSLPNGMRWIVLQRHNAPIVSCYTYASVGAAVEEDGCTGVAHLLEHLAFKGTTLVGTRDAVKESDLLDQIDELFYSLRAAKSEGKNNKAKALMRKFKELQDQAATLVVPNEYGSIIVREGGVGLNAQTSQDNTEYFVSLPSNKLELWMALESGRFIAPVFRELYSEKEVIKEERKLRVDNASYGIFTEAFKELAFPTLPYRRPVIGYRIHAISDDFEGIGRREVNNFFRENYNPSTITCAVVGDVNPSEVENLAKKYFGRWRSYTDSKIHGYRFGQWHDADKWNEVKKMKSPSFFEMKLAAQPFYMEGYYRPPSSSIDDPVISVISELLSGGRLSRFYKNIVLQRRALSATSVEAFPGDQRPCLFLLYGVPSAGSDSSSLHNILYEQLDLLKSQPPNEEEVSRVKKSARASILELFGNNLGMAKILCKYEATTGSYSNLFREIDLIECITPMDISRVANLLFDEDNCVRGSVTSAL